MGAGLPFQAPGLLGDFTLRSQWATALKKRPKWILVSSWNEHIAQVPLLPKTLAPRALNPRSQRASSTTCMGFCTVPVFTRPLMGSPIILPIA